jgi:hypothetical protein
MKNKTTFYVLPNGQAVPATGYRYVSKNAPYLAELETTGVIPENRGGVTYLTFNKYDSPNPGALQTPHDASIRVAFDTLQILEDIRVPKGNYGVAGHLEPITEDFPEFGEGGAPQAVTNRKIRIEELEYLAA